MRYIDVEPLEDKLKEHIRKTESELMLGALSTFLRLLDITPTADVAPVRHGRWEKNDYLFLDTLYRCSVCGEEFYIENGTPQENQYYYCPNCGAKMDGEKKNCDTCKHYDKRWDDAICDECTTADSHWERRNDE